MDNAHLFKQNLVLKLCVIVFVWYFFFFFITNVIIYCNEKYFWLVVHSIFCQDFSRSDCRFYWRLFLKHYDEKKKHIIVKSLHFSLYSEIKIFNFTWFYDKNKKYFNLETYNRLNVWWIVEKIIVLFIVH